MNWMEKLLITLLAQLYLKNIPPTYALLQSSIDPYENNSSTNDVSLENYIQFLSSILMKSWPSGISPLLYVEKDVEQILQNGEQLVYTDSSSTSSQDKRSKYYRKFPLKRQKYSRYDAENRYLCLPSKDEVFNLLVALHKTRQGKRGQRVNFCNRKRLAGAVFTNLRFLGK
ncbi:uncharacterized protein LOC123677953 [Harmonia axyridis]|uniref:uncharacterized protein LOC123677953 n=1 Tax=Harmonia axyridis TaxID=115357 RepID=UPI001E2797D0|nr:uncharacterized protein LOC123677953 [Harmonia axyridis]XP_045470661.1 uncharacterized protein LOC123677953 [Harmonia axyridis]